MAAPPSVGAPDAAADAHLHPVVAPFTGVFYRSPTPAARPYVATGDWVEADAVIGLVETMKIFNEVTADLPGRIARFAADNGQLVHAGDPLVSHRARRPRASGVGGQSSAMSQPYVRISGWGKYLPERIMPNSELARLVDTSDEWIRARTGIGERRVAAPDETTCSLAVAAARPHSTGRASSRLTSI